MTLRPSPPRSWSRLEAIHIATQNSAEFLWEGSHIDRLKASKQAEIVVIKGDASRLWKMWDWSSKAGWATTL